MKTALDDERVPIVYLPKFREWGLSAGGPAIQTVAYCPWCGVELPSSLRDEFFDRLDALGVEIEDAPREFADDRWWATP